MQPNCLFFLKWHFIRKWSLSAHTQCSAESAEHSGCSFPHKVGIKLRKGQRGIYWNLKLQSVSFASLSPSLYENLELQLCAELSSVRGVVLRHGSSADESNVLRWMCSSQSPHRCGCLLYFAIADSSLCLGIYDPNKNFHCILPSEQVSNKSATFVLTNWEKKHFNKSRYQ